MFVFPSKKPRLGLDITSSEVRIAALSGSGSTVTVYSAEKAELPAGLVNESYSSLNIADPEGLSSVLRDLQQRTASLKARRTGVSLPDAIFRVQTLEFDELPGKAEDRERLVRWRFEKSAAFDMSDTILRYQVLKRQGKGVMVLSCIAKRDVIAQYEALLLGLGLEPWLIGPSSFHTLNFYFPHMVKKSSRFALASVGRTAFTAIVMEHGGPRFYRSKEIKASGPGDVRGRLMREVDDSLHFYTHQDRSQQSEIGHLFLTGDAAVLDSVASGLKESTPLDIEVLSPAAVLPLLGSEAGNSALPGAMAAALGAGGTV
jgi:Tfp pilus assembly PilM family ATPase